jgi:general secretion pathway protein C
MSTTTDYSKLIALLLIASGLGLIVWSGWSVLERHYPQLLGGSGGGSSVQVKTTLGREKLAQYSVNEIVAAHLFGKADAENLPQKTQIAPETKLKLKLLGVVATDDEHYARAMIEVSSKGMKTYSIGQSIEGTDALLHKVESDKVILDRKGNLESLAMVREKTDLGRSKPQTG